MKDLWCNEHFIHKQLLALALVSILWWWKDKNLSSRLSLKWHNHDKSNNLRSFAGIISEVYRMTFCLRHQQKQKLHEKNELNLRFSGKSWLHGKFLNCVAKFMGWWMQVKRIFLSACCAVGKSMSTFSIFWGIENCAWMALSCKMGESTKKLWKLLSFKI